MSSFSLRTATADQIEALHIIERASFPSDEAASLENMRKRCHEASSYFQVYVDDLSGQAVGYINGTCVKSSDLHHDCMSIHDPEGKILVLHSVTVEQAFRRKRIGQRMLLDYLQYIKGIDNIEEVMLLSKAYLLEFYIRCGFAVTKLSPIVHGNERWFELSLNMNEFRSPLQLQIDAFADGPFSGNPAAVVFEHRSEYWMQCLGNENNLAETAFLERIPGNEPSFLLRWFTPSKEVELCGHATLASAHALYETGRVSRGQQISFRTKYSGMLTAIQQEGSDMIDLNFPATPAIPVDEDSLLAQSLATAFKLEPVDIISIGKSPYDILVEVTSLAFANVDSIDFGIIASLGNRGVILTCLGGAHLSSDERNVIRDTSYSRAGTVCDARFDFVSRCFFPLYGINEDPVTGSAHCALCPYWDNRISILAPREKGTPLVGFQASARGGIVQVQLMEDRVKLSGKCITTITSKIRV